MKEVDHPPEGPVVGGLAQHLATFGEHASEGGGGDRVDAADQQGPDEAAVEAVGAGGDEVGHQVRHLGDQVDGRGLVPVVLGDQGAEVDPGGLAEDGGDVLGELFGPEYPGLGVRDLRGIGGLDLVQGLGERGDVTAQGDVVQSAVGLERVEAGHLGEQVHDQVVAPHQVLEPRSGLGEEHVAVGVGEAGGFTLHRGTEDVDPSRQGHVEGRVAPRDVQSFEHGRELELLDNVGRGLEVLVPRDQLLFRVAGQPDAPLQRDHAQEGVEDLVVVGVAVESVDHDGHEREPVPHGLVVDAE